MVQNAEKNKDAASGQSCHELLSQSLSDKKMKTVVAARCGEKILDLAAPVPTGCQELEPIFFESAEGLAILRHSSAHVMAEAVKKLFPDARVAIGPDIENGFYYDFELERPFTPEDLERIEQEMAVSVAADRSFVRRAIVCLLH